MNKKLKYLIKSKAKEILKGERITDDFNWNLYHEHYKGEIEDSEKKYTRILSTGDYVFADKKLTLGNNIKPLHPNCRLLYETILQLNAKSVIEIGCGGGDNLSNLGVLSPDLNLYGIDISIELINYSKNRHPKMNAEISQLDITLPHPINSPKVDIAFTQAVIMHIKTGNGHLIAISNLFRYATQQVILMENWRSHNFMGDIEFLYSKRMIPWKEIYMHYRYSEELKKPHIMIISSKPLGNYNELTDYSILF